MPSRARRIYLWFWMLGSNACSFTNPLRRGGPLYPPAPDGFSYGFGCCAPRRVRLQILHVGADRRLRPHPSDFHLFLDVGLHGVFGYGRHQDDRDDHQFPPGTWFPQSREWNVLSCVRLVDSPGRLCLRPPPNTPLRIRLVCQMGCSFTNPPRRGGPLWPPAPDGFSFGFVCWAPRRARLRPSPRRPR